MKNVNMLHKSNAPLEQDFMINIAHKFTQEY